MSTFTQALERLNPEQRLAVETIEGPVLVLAGPGTGKTQILTTRIACILEKTQAQPHNILALTFTNAAAKNMQQRLVAMIGTPGYAVRCTTFHSFCADVISQHPESFPVAATSSEAIAEVDKLVLIEAILDEYDFVHIKNPKNPRFYVKDCLQLISQYKREGHTPLTLRALLHEEEEQLESGELTAAQVRKKRSQLDKNKEVLQVYSEYDRRLRELGQYDYEDMILWVRDAFREQPDLLAEFQELYQYILVDEFQDTNQGQLQVVQSISSFWGENANIFAVGDPNQSIYRFQGASLANTLSFLELYPRATVISLRTGYRCGQEIYNAAAQLIAHNNLLLTDERLADLSAPLQSFDNHLGALETFEAPDTLAECFWVLQRIQELHSEGVAYENIAILYRKHRQSALIQAVLTRAGVPVIREGSQNVFAEPLVQQLLTFLRFLSSLNTKDEAGYVLTFLRLPWLELDPLDVLKVVRAGAQSRAHQRSPWEVMHDKGALKQLELKNAEAFTQLVETCARWIGQESNLPLPRFVELVLRESGFYRYLQQEGQLVGLNAVTSFLREMQSWSAEHPDGRLADFLARLETLLAHDLRLSTAEFRLNLSAVHLTSAHQAKGQEWEHVFLLHANDGVWGNVRAPSGIAPLSNTVPYALLDKKERNEDERRLFFVALTRAKQTVHMSWSLGSVEGDRRRELQVSEFVEELRGTSLEPAGELSAEQLERFLLDHVEGKAGWEKTLQLDRAWIASLVENYSLSVSALNDFLECPVGFLFKDLIRIPVQTSPAAALGTAAHAAMEYLMKQLMQTGVVPELDKVLSVAEKSLERSGLPAAQIAMNVAHIKSVLARYYHAQRETFTPPLMVERFFGGGTPVVFEGLRLVGKIDRVDPIDLPGVKVVDYKTSAPKSRNDILGKTKSSKGGFWRQLMFYRLLGDLDPTFPYEVRLGELIFLESTDRGEYKSEAFSYDETELEDFRVLLRSVRDQLQSLKFLEKPPCGSCETCKLLGLTVSELEQQAAARQMELF